jgi:hypothetical protein
MFHLGFAEAYPENYITEEAVAARFGERAGQRIPIKL